MDMPGRPTHDGLTLAMNDAVSPWRAASSFTVCLSSIALSAAFNASEDVDLNWPGPCSLLLASMKIPYSASRRRTSPLGTHCPRPDTRCRCDALR